MRILLIIYSLTIALAASGQGNSLLGKYTHSYFMYRYFLTLRDSGKFAMEEHTDSGSTTTTGTWTISKRLIKLIPTKRIWVRDDLQHEMPLEESFISVDKLNNLTKLRPKKKPDWWPKSVKYDMPDYKLRKLTIVDNNFFIVNFLDGLATLKSKVDSLVLDSLGKMLNRYSKEFARHEICLISYYSPSEASIDKLIGVKRGQAVKEYLMTKYKINQWSFWIQDRENQYQKEPIAWIRLEKWKLENEIIY